MSSTKLPLQAINATSGTQSRAQLNQATVAEYAEALALGAEFPPVTVFSDGAAGGNWLADGFHRFHAHRAAGVTEISCDLRVGTQRDAVLFSVGANAAHGLRRTNDDKRRAVQTLLGDPEWSKWSDNAIAKACGVSHPFVGDLRRAILKPLQDSSAAATRTVERNGVTYEQNTANIGTVRPAAVEPGSAPAVESDSTSSPMESDSTQAPAAPVAAAVAAPTVPETLGSDVDEDNDALTQLVADFEAVQSERDQLAAKVAELEERVKFLTQGDLAAEADRWKQNFEGLSNRNRDLQSKAREAQLLAKSLGDLLAKIRLALGVESSAEILPALAARRAA